MEQFYNEAYMRRDFAYKMNGRMIELMMDQRKLSELTGISQSAISRYSRAEAMPTIYNAYKIAKVLGFTTADELAWPWNERV